MKHRRTDPECTQFRQPRGLIALWWFSRRRGLICRVCAVGYPAWEA
ncbi:hypothetical protein MYK68_13955 [Gordonia sp. PP30]|nr:hypothetical protein [Gordonia sp. PP30]UQE73834.1 hypothetical protein MYK68_13955 [Gordonia sp. PP30]